MLWQGRVPPRPTYSRVADKLKEAVNWGLSGIGPYQPVVDSLAITELQTSAKSLEIVIWTRNPNSSIFRNRNPRVLPLKRRGGLRL